MTDLTIAAPKPKLACAHLEWRNTSARPDEVPDMEPYCKAIKQFLPRRFEKEGGICGRCVLYKPYAKEKKHESRQTPPHQGPGHSDPLS